MAQKFSYNDYSSWPEEERWELIDGEAYNMTPAPSIRHQKIVNKFNITLSLQLEKQTYYFIDLGY